MRKSGALPLGTRRSGTGSNHIDDVSDDSLLPVVQMSQHRFGRPSSSSCSVQKLPPEVLLSLMPPLSQRMRSLIDRAASRFRMISF